MSLPFFLKDLMIKPILNSFVYFNGLPRRYLHGPNSLKRKKEYCTLKLVKGIR